MECCEDAKNKVYGTLHRFNFLLYKTHPRSFDMLRYLETILRLVERLNLSS